MNKKTVVVLAALLMVGVAQARVVVCPTNIKSVSDGQVIKNNSGSWKVEFTAKHMPVSVPIAASYPGLMKGKVVGKPELACFDDDKRPDRTVGRPLYSVTFHYLGACSNPKVDTVKNGFFCD